MSAPVLTGGAVVYCSGFRVDADGSPRAYHPDSALGLDRLANAGGPGPGQWYGLACNTAGLPLVQGPGDPAPGFYVSTTALADHSKSIGDPARYADSELYPYASVSRDLIGAPCRVRVGDLCWVSRGDRSCGAVVADVGPAHEYGEGSIALARALSVDPDPRRGGCESGVSWVVFPGSAAGWPRLVEDFQAHARQLFDAWGGVARLASVRE